jgi:hypothetical protein
MRVVMTSKCFYFTQNILFKGIQEIVEWRIYTGPSLTMWQLRAPINPDALYGAAANSLMWFSDRDLTCSGQNPWFWDWDRHHYSGHSLGYNLGNNISYVYGIFYKIYKKYEKIHTFFYHISSMYKILCSIAMCTGYIPYKLYSTS